MKISPERIDSIVAATHFPRETVEKVVPMLEFLKAFSETDLSKKFVLIGGTAINLGHYPAIPRLSEDIDLDYIGEPDLGLRDDS